MSDFDFRCPECGCHVCPNCFGRLCDCDVVEFRHDDSHCPDGCGMSAPTADSPCDFHCGYYDAGDDLEDHVRWEHIPCTECGAGIGDGQDADYLETYSLSHKQGCPRLQLGYIYPNRRQP